MGHRLSENGFHIEHGLDRQHYPQAARGYWQAFREKLHYPLGPEEKPSPLFQV